MRVSACSFSALTRVKIMAMPRFSVMVGARAVRRLGLSEWMSRRGVLGALGGAERSRRGGSSG